MYDGDRNLLVENREVKTNLTLTNLKSNNGIRVYIISEGTYDPNEAPALCEYTVEVKGSKKTVSKQKTTKTSTATPPARVTLKKVKAGKRQVTLTWNKVAGANGYIIYRSTKKNSGYKNVKTITNGTTLKWTNKKLRKGRRYYFKVKAYRNVNGKKVLSKNFSTVKSAKAK